MPSGGARNRSGRAPDPNALRRDRANDAEWLILPIEGRQGDTPTWPFERCTDRELELWETLWRKPVAILWERDGQLEYVAMYVRSFVEAEEPGASSSLRTFIARMAGELLLTIPAMHSARVKMAADEVGARRDEQPEPERTSARDRLTVVDSAAGG